jgi:multimeric flavodoxin WrbA
LVVLGDKIPWRSITRDILMTAGFHPFAMDLRGEELIERTEFAAGAGRIYTLDLTRRGLISLYPGMVQYTLHLKSGEKTLRLFRTNTYEYSPTSPFDAESAAKQKAKEWATLLRINPEAFFAASPEGVKKSAEQSRPDVLIIQGSPRADGNCSILAGWSSDAAVASGFTVKVVYPDDLWIRACIGCYQCYNTGFCIFDDDMPDIIASLRHARLLVICTPVYTSSVPGSLKLVIDRLQAYHAEISLYRSSEEKTGLLFSVAGRKGAYNFTCVKRIIHDCMRNLHITLAGDVLIDGIDQLRDIREIPGTEYAVHTAVTSALIGKDNSENKSA